MSGVRGVGVHMIHASFFIGSLTVQPRYITVNLLKTGRCF